MKRKFTTERWMMELMSMDWHLCKNWKEKNNKLYIVTNDFFYVAPTAMLVLLEGYLHYVRFSQSYWHFEILNRKTGN